MSNAEWEIDGKTVWRSQTAKVRRPKDLASISTIPPAYVGRDPNQQSGVISVDQGNLLGCTPEEWTAMESRQRTELALRSILEADVASSRSNKDPCRESLDVLLDSITHIEPAETNAPSVDTLVADDEIAGPDQRSVSDFKFMREDPAVDEDEAIRIVLPYLALAKALHRERKRLVSRIQEVQDSTLGEREREDKAKALLVRCEQRGCETARLDGYSLNNLITAATCKAVSEAEELQYTIPSSIHAKVKIAASGIDLLNCSWYSDYQAAEFVEHLHQAVDEAVLYESGGVKTVRNSSTQTITSLSPGTGRRGKLRSSKRTGKIDPSKVPKSRQPRRLSGRYTVTVPRPVGKPDADSTTSSVEQIRRTLPKSMTSGVGRIGRAVRKSRRRSQSSTKSVLFPVFSFSLAVLCSPYTVPRAVYRVARRKIGGSTYRNKLIFEMVPHEALAVAFENEMVQLQNWRLEPGSNDGIEAARYLQVYPGKSRRLNDSLLARLGDITTGEMDAMVSVAALRAQRISVVSDDHVFSKDEQFYSDIKAAAEIHGFIPGRPGNRIAKYLVARNALIRLEKRLLGQLGLDDEQFASSQLQAYKRLVQAEDLANQITGYQTSLEKKRDELKHVACEIAQKEGFTDECISRMISNPLIVDRAGAVSFFGGPEAHDRTILHSDSAFMHYLNNLSSIVLAMEMPGLISAEGQPCDVEALEIICGLVEQAASSAIEGVTGGITDLKAQPKLLPPQKSKPYKGVVHTSSQLQETPLGGKINMAPDDPVKNSELGTHLRPLADGLAEGKLAHNDLIQSLQDLVNNAGGNVAQREVDGRTVQILRLPAQQAAAGGVPTWAVLSKKQKGGVVATGVLLAGLVVSNAYLLTKQTDTSKYDALVALTEGEGDKAGRLTESRLDARHGLTSALDAKIDAKVTAGVAPITSGLAEMKPYVTAQLAEQKTSFEAYVNDKVEAYSTALGVADSAALKELVLADVTAHLTADSGAGADLRAMLRDGLQPAGEYATQGDVTLLRQILSGEVPDGTDVPENALYQVKEMIDASVEALTRPRGPRRSGL